MTDLRTAKHCRAYATGTPWLNKQHVRGDHVRRGNFRCDGWHSTGSNTERITPTLAGLYLVVGSLEFASNTTGLRALRLLIKLNDHRQATVGATAYGHANVVVFGAVHANR